MYDITGTGLLGQMIATVTFPTGFSITAFADDQDALTVEEITVGEAAPGLNGDMVAWSKPVLIPFSVNVIPGSDDDINLSILLDANTAGRGKTPARDLITYTLSYPDGRTVTYRNARILSGTPGRTVTSAGRIASKKYGFSAESKSESR